MSSPSYTVVIPAFNEEKFLPDTIRRLKDAMSTIPVRGEIVVVDNNSTDQTSAVARRHGARVVFETHNQIARARNTGAKYAKGSFIVFLDADTHVSSELLKQALNLLLNHNCCGGGALLSGGTNERRSVKIVYNFVNKFCTSFKFAPGCFIFCTRNAFEAVGGFDERFYASEELWFSKNLSSWGKTQGLNFKIIENPKITTSSRKMDHPGQSLLAAVCLILLPFSPYFRSLCWFWYRKLPRKTEYF